jgi:hypothetical protein
MRESKTHKALPENTKATANTMAEQADIALLKPVDNRLDAIAQRRMQLMMRDNQKAWHYKTPIQKSSNLGGTTVQRTVSLQKKQKVAQRLVIPANVLGLAKAFDTDVDFAAFSQYIEQLSDETILKNIIVFIEKNDQNEFSVVEVYNRLWQIVHPARVAEVTAELNTQIPRQLHVPQQPVALPAQGGQHVNDHVAIDIPDEDVVDQVPILQDQKHDQPVSVPMPVQDLVGQPPPQQDQHDHPLDVQVPVHDAVVQVPELQDQRAPVQDEIIQAPDQGGHALDIESGPANVQPGRLDRVRKKGFGGTTIGDISNSLGVGATIASIVSDDANVSGGLGIGGGLGVALGGYSQVGGKASASDNVKGTTNMASGLAGISSGVVGMLGNSDVASILGRISGGAWGLAEAINFVQKANTIYQGKGTERDYLHALNSLLKGGAGVLLAISGAEGILILASVLGGLGAVSSVILGLKKLYDIYKSGGEPENPEEMV